MPFFTNDFAIACATFNPVTTKALVQPPMSDPVSYRQALGRPVVEAGELEEVVQGGVERAALRKVGRKGGARTLPSSLVSEEAYATPLEEREMPPAMRKKRKLAQGGQAAAAATDVV